jgi:2-dehydro-3-deoxyphosphogluconate aldolase / (4S)-4-hydroxy-2-oxoglutarate aldolase
MENTFRALIEEAPVVAIIRRPKIDPFRCVDLLLQNGVRLIEITVDSENALPFLRRVRESGADNALFGAGTIRNPELARQAVGAGANFLVTPNLDLDVIRYARERGISICAGAMTPTEIHAAYVAGADMIKVFPAGTLGPNYFRELRGPFAEIPLIATGGVTISNAADFRLAGVNALGVGGALIPKEDTAEAFSRCAEAAKAFLAVFGK